MTLDEILFEWSYRCPKGYPTIVDGKFVDRDEVVILNELLVQKGFPTFTLPEATIIKPNIGSNDTALKEGMVCFFYDMQEDSTLSARFDKLQTEALKPKEKVTSEQVTEINSITKEMQDLYDANKSRYGSKASKDVKGSMPPDTLPKYIQWTLLTKDKEGVKKVNNSLSAAKVIRKTLGDAIIFRNEDFDAIRTVATQRALDLGIPNLKPDNWCPGDVYLTKNMDSVQKALESSFEGLAALNANFVRTPSSNGIVAVSLKMEDAQAGKATEFANKLFVSAFDAKMSKEDIDATDTPSNKAISNITSAVKRYKGYNPNPDYSAVKRSGKQKSYIASVLDGSGKLDTSVNTMLKAAGKEPWSNDKLVKADNDTAFYNKNKILFNNLDDAVIILDKKLSGKSVVDGLKTNFFATRKSFIEGLKKYNVQVAAKDSKLFYDDILKEKNSTNILSKKIGVYNLALTIIDKWVNREKANPAYSKLTKITNPFAALTAFAVAESGINPGFWKAIGKNSELMGTMSWFDPKAKVAVINNKTTPIILKDESSAEGFNLDYTTTIGTHKYKTTLSFRYSDGQIRIEVQELIKQ